MDWEIVLLLALGLPFALINWTASSLVHLKACVVNRPVARRPARDPFS